jgi:hypothetical protein
MVIFSDTGEGPSAAASMRTRERSHRREGAARTTDNDEACRVGYREETSR